MTFHAIDEDEAYIVEFRPPKKGEGHWVGTTTLWVCEDDYPSTEPRCVIVAVAAKPDRVRAGSDRRPHSRACGWREHEHGPACHSNCPTCHGAA